MGYSSEPVVEGFVEPGTVFECLDADRYPCGDLVDAHAAFSFGSVSVVGVVVVGMLLSERSNV